MPQFVGIPDIRTAQGRRSAADQARCAGELDPARYLVDIRSPDFVRIGRDQQIQSEVSVLPSAALVAADLTAAVSARGLACTTKAAHQELTLAAGLFGQTVGAASITALNLRTPTADRIAGYRISIPTTAQTTTVTVTLDLFTFGRGAAEISMSVLSFGPLPPASVEQRLLTVLASRSRAHPL